MENPGVLLSSSFAGFLHGEGSPPPSSAPGGSGRLPWAAWDPTAVHTISRSNALHTPGMCSRFGEFVG